MSASPQIACQCGSTAELALATLPSMILNEISGFSLGVWEPLQHEHWRCDHG